MLGLIFSLGFQLYYSCCSPPFSVASTNVEHGSLAFTLVRLLNFNTDFTGKKLL